MKKPSLRLPAIVLFLFICSCKMAVNPADLYGKWKYTKVEHPDASPPDSLRKEEIDYEAPTIQFTKADSVVMVWGGKVLSHGTFTTDGQNIRIKELQPDGKTRDFNFWVIKLDEKEIVFETTVEGKSRITAVR